MYLHGHSNLDAHTSQLFTEFISKPGYDPKNFLGVAIDDLPLVEELVERDIFIYVFDIQDVEYVGELARRSIGNFEKTVKLLRFNNHFLHMNDVASIFKCFRCPRCDCFLKRSNNFKTHLLTCKDRMRHIYNATKLFYLASSWSIVESLSEVSSKIGTSLRFSLSWITVLPIAVIASPSFSPR